MANLLGQNIGTNYKGILNLNTLNGNLTTTLEAITDGDGNASPLNLATASIRFGGTTGLFWDNANNRLGVGTSSPSRTLTIAGDGARIKDLNIGVTSGTTIGNTSNIIANWSNLGVGIASGAGITASAMLHVRGDGTNSIQRWETSAGTEVSRVDSAGKIESIGYTTNMQRVGLNNGTFATILGYIIGSSNGVLRLTNNAENDFGRLQLGGTTTAFPAIKRNGAGIDFRLADDSAACVVNAAAFNTASVNVGSNFIAISGDSGFLRPAASTLAISLNGFSNNHFEFRKNSDATVVGIIKGTGSPESVITANAGSIFLRTDGGILSTFYVKQSGTGNTGWAAIA